MYLFPSSMAVFNGLLNFATSISADNDKINFSSNNK